MAETHLNKHLNMGKLIIEGLLRLEHDERGCKGIVVTDKFLNSKEELKYSLRPDIVRETAEKGEEIFVLNNTTCLLHGLPNRKPPKRMMDSYEYTLLAKARSHLWDKRKERGDFDFQDEVRYRLNRRDMTKQMKKEHPERESSAISRKAYHGTRAKAARMVNAMIKSCINEADEDALKLARRFGYTDRGEIYAHSVRHKYLMQLYEAFPLLAVRVLLRTKKIGGNIYDLYTDEPIIIDREHFIDRVLSGEKMRVLADEVEIPMCLRGVKPQNTRFAEEGFILTLAKEKPELFRHHMPTKTMEQYRWLKALLLTQAGGQDYIRWCAKRMPTKTRLAFLERSVRNMRDTFREEPWNDTVLWEGGYERSVAWHAEEQRRNLERQRLWQEQNQALHQEMDERQRKERERLAAIEAKPWPEPWIEGIEKDGLKIVPIVNKDELYEEAARMHHCVGNPHYEHRIKDGNSYIYSLRSSEGKRIATFELIKGTSSAREVFWNRVCDGVDDLFKAYDGVEGGFTQKIIEIEQMHGPCNSEVLLKHSNFVKKWLKDWHKRKNVTDSAMLAEAV